MKNFSIYFGRKNVFSYIIKIFLLFTTLISLDFLFAEASLTTASADTPSAPSCHVKQSGGGYGAGSITFFCDNTVNLKQQPITFQTSNNSPATSASGGTSQTSGSCTVQQGSPINSTTVTLWYAPPGQSTDFILPPNTDFKLQFSIVNTTDPTFNVQNFAIGGTPPGPQGLVQFNKSTASANIPGNAVVVLTPQSTGGQTYTWTWPQVQSPLLVDCNSYNVSAYIIDAAGNKVQIITTPTQISVTQKSTQQIVLNYQPFTGSLAFYLNQTMPAGVSTNVPVTITDQQTQSTQTYSVPWSNKAAIFNNISLGHTYTFSALPVYGTTSSYSFNFNPATVKISNAAQVPVMLTASATPLVFAPTYVTLSGLPANTTTTLHFIANVPGAPNYDFTVGNGKNTAPYNLITGAYTLSAASVLSNGQRYVMQAQTINVQTGQNNFAVNFAAAKPIDPVMPYKDMGTNMINNVTPATSNVQLMANAAGHYSFVFAFIVQGGTNGCNPLWGGNSMAVNYFVPDAQFLHQHGGSVAISFGGENGVNLQSACTANELANTFATVTDLYHPEYLDFDIEGTAVSPSAIPNLTNLFNGLLIFQRTHPDTLISLTLPANIDGLSPDGVNVVKLAQQVGVQIGQYNLMTMAWESQKELGKDTWVDVQDAVNSAVKEFQGVFPNGVPLSQIRVTPKIGVDYDYTKFLVSDAQSVAAFAKNFNGAGPLAGVSFWSTDEDWEHGDPTTCTASLGQATNDCSGIVQQPFDFIHAFDKGLH